MGGETKKPRGGGALDFQIVDLSTCVPDESLTADIAVLIIWLLGGFRST